MQRKSRGEAIWRGLRDGSWIYDPRARFAAFLWAAAMLPLLAAMMATYLRVGLTDGAGEVFGEDFVDCWVGGRFAWAGHGADAYDFRKYLAIVRDVAGAPTDPLTFNYLPSYMILCAPFALLPYVAGAIAWILGGILILFLLMRRLLDWRGALFATLAAPATFINALFGQNGAFTALFLGGGLLMLRRSPLLAGLLLGLLSFKPQLGVLLPVALAFGGCWRAFVAATAGVLILFGASIAFAGWDAWLAAPARMEWMGHFIAHIGEGLWHRIPSTFMAVRFLFDVDPAIAWLVHAPAALAALAAVVWVWRRPSEALSVKAATLVLATFIFTPYVWDNDMVVLVLIWAWRLTERNWKPWEATALTFAVAMPFFLAPAARFLGLPIGPAVLLFALWAVARDAPPAAPTPASAR